MGNGLILKQRMCAAKLETVAGTMETLAAADGAENFYDPTMESESPLYERQMQGSLSRLPGVPGAIQTKFTAKTHLYNSGTTTAPFWVTNLLLACDVVNTAGTIAPKTGGAATGPTTISIAEYIAGNRYALSGGKGTFKITADKIGEPVKLEWEFTGAYVAPSAAALLAPDYPDLKPPTFKGATITLGGAVYVVKKVAFDAGLKVVMREDATSATGYITAIITDRQSKLSITVEVPPVGTHDFYTDFNGSTTAAFVMSIGSGTNGVVTLNVPKAQVANPPKHGDADGLFTYDLEFTCTKNTDAGDDEWSIVLT